MMERLTRPTVEVDETAAKYMGKGLNMETMNDRLLELILNGPTLVAVPQDHLRHIIRQLYGALKAYEDIWLTPEQVKDMAENAEARFLIWFEAKYGFSVGKLMELIEAEQGGRLMVFPGRVCGGIGETIKEARKEAGLTQAELGKRLGVKFSMISEWERGKRKPKPESIKRIMDALKKEKEPEA